MNQTPVETGDDEDPSGALPQQILPGVWVVGGELDEEQIATLARARAALQDDDPSGQDDDEDEGGEKCTSKLSTKNYTHACDLPERHDGRHVSADGFWWTGPVASEQENPALVLRVFTEGGRVKLGTSGMRREQAAMILMHVAEDILEIKDWKDDEVDLRNY